MRFLLKSAAVLAVAAGSTAAWATPLILSNVDQGWYHPANGHAPVSKNYAVGYGGNTYRNFVVFDLSSLPGPVSSATVRIRNSAGDGGLWQTFDVTTDLAVLVANQTVGAVTDAVHADLGTGVAFGSALIAGTGTDNELTLNAAALASINAAIGGLWAIGGRMDNGWAFYGSGGAGNGTAVGSITLALDYSVPEPATLAVLGLGLAGLGLGRSRTRRTRAQEKAGVA